MGGYVASQMGKAMIGMRIQVEGARVLLMGLTFKENCPDLRNTRVVDVVYELQDYGVTVDVHDTWVDPSETRAEYGLEIAEAPEADSYDRVILAVALQWFLELGANSMRAFGNGGHVLRSEELTASRGERFAAASWRRLPC